jgi:hypothetical protein
MIRKLFFVSKMDDKLEIVLGKCHVGAYGAVLEMTCRYPMCAAAPSLIFRCRGS